MTYGTLGRIYGGNPNLLHIADGQRALAGQGLAVMLEAAIRREAVADGARTEHEAETQKLCPGCYMIALIDAALALAEANGQSQKELCETMAQAFWRLASHPEQIEEIEIAIEGRYDEPQ